MRTLGEHLGAYAPALRDLSPELNVAGVFSWGVFSWGVFSWLESPEGVDLSEGRRDLDDQVLTIRIGLPVFDVALSDKDGDPQSRNEVDPCFIRAAHVIPGDLHPIRPMMRLSSSPSPRKTPPPVATDEGVLSKA
jgi:hypothetical protein